MQFIDLKKQYEIHKNEIDEAIHEVLDEGQYIQGRQVVELERMLADYVGSRHCIGVSSGTCSLHVALLALGIGHGDEVITVPFTWISSAEVVKLAGATPVFVDIEEDSYNIDVEKMEEAITSRTKAIIAVNLFGQMANFVEINRIAERYGIAVIEDAAQSFGAEQHGRRSCSAGTIGSTSFFPAKALGCYGDGGALFCDDDALAYSMRAIRTHGGVKRHEHTHLGMNARLDTLQAAILKVKLKYFPQELEERIRIGTRYSVLLRDNCIVPKIMEGNNYTYAYYTIRTEFRDDVERALKEASIPCGIYYPKCLHEQPVFTDLGYKRGNFPVAEKAAREVISLPMHPWLTEKEQDKIVEVVLSVLPASVH